MEANTPTTKKWLKTNDDFTGFHGAMGRMAFFKNNMKIWGVYALLGGAFMVSMLVTKGNEQMATIMLGAAGLISIPVVGYSFYASISHFHRRVKDIRGTAVNANIATAVAFVLYLIPYINLIVGFSLLFWPGQASQRANGITDPEDVLNDPSEYEQAA